MRSRYGFFRQAITKRKEFAAALVLVAAIAAPCYRRLFAPLGRGVLAGDDVHVVAFRVLRILD